MVRYYKRLCEDTTNNREELKAILKVFQLSQTPEYKGVELVIYSDSAYAVNMINSWIHSWSRNNWKNSKKKEVCPDGSPDQNVFDIMQGVSINLFIKTGKKKPNELGKVFHYVSSFTTLLIQVAYILVQI